MLRQEFGYCSLSGSGKKLSLRTYDIHAYDCFHCKYSLKCI